MRQRLLKYLKRFLIFLAVLALLGVAVFSWLCYWPFEGDVDDILTLVPEDVEFVLRCDYDDLKETGWVQENIFNDPLTEGLGEQALQALEQIELELATIQAQVDQQSPIAVDVQDFVETNVLAGEVCISGNWWEHASPRRGPPQWKELLVLKRVSRIARCVSGLQHDFIRRQVQMGPQAKLSAESDEIFKITLQGMQPVAGRGTARKPGDPDMSQWYMARVLDVIAVSNNKRLIEDVLQLGTDPEGRSFAKRPGFEIPQHEGRITAALNLDPLHNYFNRAFDLYPDLKTLRRFLPPEALVKLSGRLSLEGTDLVDGGGTINYISTPGEAEDVIRNVYGLPPRVVSSGIARLVPAEDTFAVVSLRSTPEYLLNQILWEALPPDVRKLWSDNLRKNPTAGFSRVDEFFEDLSTRIGDEAMVAMARMGDIYDKVDFPEWYSEEPEPLPALAVMVKLGEGATQAEVEEYLASKIFILGLDESLERVKLGNFTYSRGKLKVETLDYKYISPCFIVVQDHLVITSTEGYMRKILETVQDQDAKALAADETFRETMGALPQEGHIGIFVDLEKIFRVPDSIHLDVNNPDDRDLGDPGTRGFLWDKRNSWVIENRDDYAEAKRFRREERKKFPQAMGPQHEKELERRVNAHADAWLERYGEFLEEYRRMLAGMRRFRGVGIVLGSAGQDLDARFSVVFRKP